MEERYFSKVTGKGKKENLLSKSLYVGSYREDEHHK